MIFHNNGMTKTKQKITKQFSKAIISSKVQQIYITPPSFSILLNFAREILPVFTTVYYLSTEAFFFFKR
jgi:hypothetical protein